MREYDAIVVGGGPAGSTCARVLGEGGLRVLVLDRARFPRDKLCAGWVSPRLWQLADASPEHYPGALWEWRRCHLFFRGRYSTARGHGYFVRRDQLDHFLLERSRADVVEDHRVRRVERDGDAWVVDGAFRGRYLVGAGGTACPVRRALFPPRVGQLVGTRELELEPGAEVVAQHRLGADGEPALLLLDDLTGYGWCVAKGGRLCLGVGTSDARATRPAWISARRFFAKRGLLPPSANSALQHPRGHPYYLYHPGNLRRARRGSALLVGDALGLAHPITAEGIVPAMVSARLCARVIIDGDPASYPHLLRRDPRLVEHRLVEMGLAAAAQLPRWHAPGRARPQAANRLVSAGIVGTFAWMFGGRGLTGRGPRDTPVRAAATGHARTAQEES